MFNECDLWGVGGGAMYYIRVVKEGPIEERRRERHREIEGRGEGGENEYFYQTI